MNSSKLEILSKSGIMLIKASRHTRIDYALAEYKNLINSWQKRIRTKKTANNVLSKIFQDEIIDFAKYVFNEKYCTYFCCEMTLIIENIFGVAEY